MTIVKSLHLQEFPRVAFDAALFLVVTSAAWAQAAQNLTIGFQPLGNGVGAVSVPLSNWVAGGIALIVSLSALVLLRRQHNCAISSDYFDYACAGAI